MHTNDENRSILNEDSSMKGSYHELDERELGTVTGGRRLPLSQPSSAPARPPSPAPGSDAQLLRDMPLVNTQPGLRRSDSMPNLRSMGSPNLENPEAAAEIARHFIENHTVQPR